MNVTKKIIFLFVRKTLSHSFAQFIAYCFKITQLKKMERIVKT